MISDVGRPQCIVFESSWTCFVKEAPSNIIRLEWLDLVVTVWNKQEDLSLNKHWAFVICLWYLPIAYDRHLRQKYAGKPWVGFNLTYQLMSYCIAFQRGSEERLLREWLDCCVTEGGVLVAQQKVTSRPALLNQLIDDWLDRYRKLCKSKWGLR